MVNAIWHLPGSDHPVKVKQYLGVGPDGREYVSIKGSTTGIPLDELEFVNIPEGFIVLVDEAFADFYYGKNC